MKRSQRYRAAVALALASVSSSPRLRAQAPAAPEATRFEFRAPAGCSSADDFAARVRRRSWRIRLEPNAGLRSLLVEIQQPPSGGALRGIVTVVEPDGATRTRRLRAASCEEAVNALSLIATVTLDPDAMLGEPEPEPAPPPPAPKPPPKPAPRPPPRCEAPKPPRAPEYRFSLGLSATALFEHAPALVPGGSGLLALEIGPGSLLSPLFRLGVTHAQRRAISLAVGDANFAFTFPTLDVCPVRLGPRRLGLRPCGFASAGLLEVWGSGIRRGESHARFYGEGGAALLALLRVSQALEIIADGRIGLPLVRQQYGFDHVPVFTTPTPGFSASLGAAGGFP